jgi:hypothetical protein
MADAVARRLIQKQSIYDEHYRLLDLHNSANHISVGIGRHI